MDGIESNFLNGTNFAVRIPVGIETDMIRTLRILMAIGIASTLPAVAREDNPQKRPLFVSPDGRFGIHIDKTEDSDGIAMTQIDLVDVKSGTKLCELGTLGSPWAAGFRILWSPDSRRLAFVSPGRRGDWTDVWVLNGKSFEKAGFPEMPSLDLKRDHYAKTVLASYSALRWTKPDVLLLDYSAEDDEGNSAQMRVALHYDADNHASVSRVTGTQR